MKSVVMLYFHSALYGISISLRLYKSPRCASVFRIWQNGFKSALEVSWILGARTDALQRSICAHMPGDVTPPPSSSVGPLCEDSALPVVSQSVRQPGGQAVSQSARPTTDGRCVSTSTSGASLGLSIEKAPALETIEHFDLLFPTCCFFVFCGFPPPPPLTSGFEK